MIDFMSGEHGGHTPFIGNLQNASQNYSGKLEPSDMVHYPAVITHHCKGMKCFTWMDANGHKAIWHSSCRSVTCLGILNSIRHSPTGHYGTISSMHSSLLPTGVHDFMDTALNWPARYPPALNVDMISAEVTCLLW